MCLVYVRVIADLQSGKLAVTDRMFPSWFYRKGKYDPKNVRRGLAAGELGIMVRHLVSLNDFFLIM